ncbi:MAG: TolC family protein [Chitinophagaceae bacterium]|nr:TolC family protein [Chitinophagaceae bacterium]MCW5929732.1 TolC family protein [Chitinophagaceae bacterium]
MRKSFLGLWLITLSANLAVKAQDNKWDLRRCVEYAREHNIQVRQQHIQANLAHLDYTQAKYSQLPSLNGSLQGGWNFGRSVDQVNYTYSTQTFFQTNASLTSSVTLFNWFSRTNTTRANRLTAEAERLQEEKVKNDVSLNVANLYLQVLFNIQQADINETRLAQSRAQYENTRKQVDAGALPELNAVELEAQVGVDSANWIQAKTNIELSVLQLKNALNLPADTTFVVDAPPVESIPVDNILEVAPSAIYEMALASLPQFRVNDLRLQAAERNYKAAYGQLFPTISAYGQLNTLSNNRTMEGYGNFMEFNPVIGTVGTLPGALEVNAVIKQRMYDNYRNTSFIKQYSNNFGQNLGFSLNVPIFNGLSLRNNVRRQKLNIENQQMMLEQDRLNMKRDIYDAYQQALGAFEKYNASKKSVESAQKAFDYATRRYNIGVLQTIQWLNNQNTLAEAKINALIAQFDYVFKMKVLEFYKGQGIKL